MKAVVFRDFGGPEVLNTEEVEKPAPDDYEVLIQVAAATVNKQDLWQRQGTKPAMSKSPYLGTECSGRIVALGRFVDKHKIGDKVCAVVEGGCYAEYVTAHQSLVVQAPLNLNLFASATLPYAGCVVIFSLFQKNTIIKGQTILIHWGDGHVGYLAIQIARYYGLRVFVAVGTNEKINFCNELKADVCLNYSDEDYCKRVHDETNTLGVNYILDCSAKGEFEKDLKCLAIGGRLVVIGGLNGEYGHQHSWTTKLDLLTVYDKRIEVLGLDQQSFTYAEMEELLRRLCKEIWPEVEKFEIKPMIYNIFTFDEAKEAHLLMESCTHVGKVVLIPSWGSTMKAVVFQGLNCPEVLKVEDVMKPVPTDYEVLIEVAATTVYKQDLWRRQGCYKTLRTTPSLGVECSGRIVAVGRLAYKFNIGDKVCAVVEGGGYAEFVAAHQSVVVRAPLHLDFTASATLPFAGCIFIFSFFKMNMMKEGQTILIHGGAGGVGSLAIQVAKYYGLRVFVTVERKEKINFCKELKADVCINYLEEDYCERVHAETSTSGVDYILDCSDKEEFEKDLKCLAIGGKLIIIVGQHPWVAKLDLQLVYDKRIEIMGLDLRNMTYEEMEGVLDKLSQEIWPAVEKSEIEPMISKIFTFDEAKEAHLLMESPACMGNVVLVPSWGKTLPCLLS